MEEGNNKEEFDKHIEDNTAVVADFWAPWCGPCKMVMPVLEKLSESYSTVKFVKVNVDDNKQLSSEYNISSIPSVLFFKDGKLSKTEIGIKPQGTLEENVNSLL